MADAPAALIACYSGRFIGFVAATACPFINEAACEHQKINIAFMFMK